MINSQDAFIRKIWSYDWLAVLFHPFYVKNEDGTGQWKAASNLEAGEELLTEDGKKVFVLEVRVEKLEEEIRVYNLELDEVHTYYVDDGVLVHNMCATNKNKKENAGGSAGDGGANTGVGNPVEVAGRGSTGRTVPNSLEEQMAMHSSSI